MLDPLFLAPDLFSVGPTDSLDRIAASFTQVASSLVSDVILPIVSLLPFLNRNLSEKFVVLKGGSSYQKGHGYNTRKLALDDGAVVMAYGYVRAPVVTFMRKERSRENWDHANDV